MSNTLSRYQTAQILMQGVFTKNVAFNTTLYPHWIGDSDCFWYIRETATGQSFQRFDAKAKSQTEAFNHKDVASALAAASGENLASDNLPLSDLDLTLAPECIEFTALGNAGPTNKKRQAVQSAPVCHQATKPRLMAVKPFSPETITCGYTILPPAKNWR